MGWLNKLFGKTVEKDAAPLPAAYSAWLQGNVTSSDIARRYSQNIRAKELVERARACSDLQTCLNMNAEFCANQPMRLYRSADAAKPFNGAKSIKVKNLKRAELRSKEITGKSSMYAERAGANIEEVVEHPVLDLLRKPNFINNWSDFAQNCFYFLELTGNMYLQPIYEDSDVPTAIMQLYPQFMMVEPNETNFINGYRMQNKDSNIVWFNADEIDHLIYRRSKYNQYEGEGWVSSVLMEVEVLVMATASQVSLWLNNGVPDKILKLSEDYAGLTPTQLEQLEAKFKQQYGGLKNRGRFQITAMIDSVLDVGSTPKELQFIEILKEFRKAVWRAGGIPESVFETNGANLASALAGSTQYARMTIQPRLINFAEQMTNLLLPRFGLKPGEYFFAFDNAVPVDKQFTQNQAVSNIQNGIWTPNEARAAIDYPPIQTDWADSLHSAAATAEARPTAPGAPASEPSHPMAAQEAAQSEVIGTSTSAPESQPPAAPAKELDTEAHTEEEADFVEKASVDTVETKNEITCSLKACKSDAYFKSRKLSVTDKKNVDETIQRLVVSLRSWFAESVDSQHFDNAKLQAVLENPISKLFNLGGKRGLAELASVEGGRELLASLDISWDVNNPERDKFLKEYVVRLADKITAEQQAQLKDALSTSINEGETSRDATNRVFETLKLDEEWKAERIALTESARTYSQGELSSWKEAGVEGKQWILAAGSCPVCDEIAKQFNDKAVPLDSNFFDKGTSLEHEGGTFKFDYESIDSPPAHPACRCAVIPVIRMAK